MADPVHHAISSARKWGGEPGEYQHIHDWFDETKAWLCNPRHRAIRHHAEGIKQMMELFSRDVNGVKIPSLILSTGREVPLRWIGEQHVMEDTGGYIPTAAEWLEELPLNHPWMAAGARKLSRELTKQDYEPVVVPSEVRA